MRLMINIINVMMIKILILKKMIDFIYFSLALCLGYILYFILNKYVKDKRTLSYMLTSFYLGFLCLYIVQQITHMILFNGGFISNIKTIPLFNVLPSRFLSYIGLWVLLFLAIPVLGILFRTFDKKK